ncbi:5-methyltetrahydropteroyltriglutamate--homocysteine methyltransferase [Vibrio sp. qd031]|uniref:5-methyltetrahydropteroyltriglutamate-- homocysteine S-methyltransferase n=1 Tax=Vibrio sp. qd031 TaxID=1603038 RepID=UPI000A0FC923|nr:5-methyltetrahydropteroyltriglutamate--homocysteine S-methyltransferase [Vibrio sp. qd031]ORT49639.1 5-methyltetrahydropteroyltriglutamate--homocysteine methyltransferase [Vibrio sp. qd031]
MSQANTLNHSFKSHVLGYPRVGEQRELKFALEKYWKGEFTEQQLRDVGKTIRQQNWATQSQLSFVTVGDFAWYDHVLSTSALIGHLPKRHRGDSDISLDTLFKVARGQSNSGCCGAAASDMTKWFNTNYHYITPEFSADDKFAISSSQLFDEIEEALALGHSVKPVLLGPISYLYLGKEVDSFDRLTLLPKLVAVYQQVIQRLADLGIEWLQIDEPILSLDLPSQWLQVFKPTYDELGGTVKLLLSSYFDRIDDKLATINTLRVDGVHLDLVANEAQLIEALSVLPNDWVISLGVVNGRNVWKCDTHYWLENLSNSLNGNATSARQIWIGSSCSLLHSPLNLELETQLPADTKSWFAFAKQKVSEVCQVTKALSNPSEYAERVLAYSRPIHQRKNSINVHKPQVQQKLQRLKEQSSDRLLPFPERQVAQRNALNLPLFPTTTIGSFPQTGDIRRLRSQFKTGALTFDAYRKQIQSEIKAVVERQESLDLDVLVHGEPERNDMAEYFAEQLNGFQTTQYGWVQSYGSRCVKPAIVVEDIERVEPMTVDWTRYAQSLTTKPMKGMLTGPVTLMCWTFPREDITRQTITQQLAIALKEEVSDLQDAGINIIQIDEPALREGLPLRLADQQHYLEWAVDAFKVSASSALPETQIHTHMCYSDFNQIIDSVAHLDADVITIETSRSNMELLDAFEAFDYPNEIGPGVYDIHSPNIPSEQWMEQLVKRASTQIPKERLWINPDCGLKTRGWDETEKSLKNMVNVAKKLRREFA